MKLKIMLKSSQFCWFFFSIFCAKTKRFYFLEVNHLHFVMTDLAIWYDERKKVSLITYVIISPFFFSMMISQLSLEMSIARKNAFVISQNKGCQIPYPLFIFSAFNFSLTRFSLFYIVLWISRAMKLLSGTVTSCPDFHITIHKKKQRKKNLNFRAKIQYFLGFYSKIQENTIFSVKILHWLNS